MAANRKHQLDKGLGLFPRFNMTHKAWETIIMLTAYIWSKEMQNLHRVLLSGGNPMCVRASLHHILEEREKIAVDLGKSSKENEISTTFDVSKSLVCRVEYLDNKRLLTHCVDAPSAILM